MKEGMNEEKIELSYKEHAAVCQGSGQWVGMDTEGN